MAIDDYEKSTTRLLDLKPTKWNQWLVSSGDHRNLQAEARFTCHGRLPLSNGFDLEALPASLQITQFDEAPAEEYEDHDDSKSGMKCGHISFVGEFSDEETRTYGSAFLYVSVKLSPAVYDELWHRVSSGRADGLSIQLYVRGLARLFGDDKWDVSSSDTLSIAKAALYFCQPAGTMRQMYEHQVTQWVKEGDQIEAIPEHLPDTEKSLLAANDWAVKMLREGRRYWRRELGRVCLTEAIKCSDSENSFKKRLGDASDFMNVLETALIIGWFKWKVDSSNDRSFDIVPSGQAVHSSAYWHHRHLEFILNHGISGFDYFRLNWGDLLEATNAYLALPWLRHPGMDWLILDAMVGHATVYYCEVTKSHLYVEHGLDDLPLREQFPLTKLFPNFELTRSYLQTGGDLLKMQRLRFRSLLMLRASFWGVALGLPATAFFLAASGSQPQGIEKLAFWFLAIYVPLLILYCSVTASVRLWRAWLSRNQGSPEEQFLSTHQLMLAAYQLLGLKVISPHELRDRLFQVSQQSKVVWPTPIRALIERVIECDGAVWVPWQHR